MKLTIKEATILSLLGREIPMEKVKDGFIVNVAGSVNTKGKEMFIRLRVLYENGSFFLQKGEEVKVIPKVANISV